MVAALLFAPEASAQVAAGPPAGVGSSRAETAAQASFDTSYLLALYMTQLATAGAAPSRADIDEAARRYFTNGATVTSVPSSGPGAAYFQNGAAVTGVPSSGPGAAYFHNGAEVMAYRAPVAPPPVASEPPEVDAGLHRAIASPERAAAAGAEVAQSAAIAEAPGGARAAVGLTCSPREIEAAIAIASQFARAEAPSPPAASCAPSAAAAAIPVLAPPAETVPTLPAEPARRCVPAPSSLVSRLVAAFGGALVGGLVVALWSRPRSHRMAPSQ